MTTTWPEPDGPGFRPSPAGDPLMTVRQVSHAFASRTRRGLFERRLRLPVLADVSFEVRRGELLALLGASGCGKSTLARIMANLLRPDGGEIRLEGVAHHERRGPERRDLHRRLQLIQQDTRGTLDPRMKVGAQIEEPLVIHRLGDVAARRHRRASLLRAVGLDPARHGDRLPHMLSGGERQRVVIARALSLEPEILICDEPVSALDVTVQARIVDLLQRLRRDRGLTLVFITHDVRLAARIADRIAVLDRGRLVEIGPTATVIDSPSDPFTRRLLQSARGRRRTGDAVPALAAGVG